MNVRLSANDCAQILLLASAQLCQKLPATGDQRAIGEAFIARLAKKTVELQKPATVAALGQVKLFSEELSILDTTEQKIRASEEERKRVERNLNAVIHYLRAGVALVSYQLNEFRVYLSIPHPKRGAGKKVYTATYAIGLAPEDTVYEQSVIQLERDAFEKCVTAASVRKHLRVAELPAALQDLCKARLTKKDYAVVIEILNLIMSTLSFSERVVYLNKLFNFRAHTEVISPASFDYCYLTAAYQQWLVEEDNGGDPIYDDIDFVPRLAASVALSTVQKCLALRVFMHDGNIGPLDVHLGPRPQLQSSPHLFNDLMAFPLSQLLSDRIPALSMWVEEWIGEYEAMEKGVG